jgi:CspA family cold shock protein
MRKLAIFVIGLILIGTLAGCGSESTVVDSGTYEGTIEQVKPEETEIYVNVPNTGTLELYFKESTSLLRNGEEVPFDTLESGQSVRVQVERVGQRLDPVEVEILD